MNGAIPNADGVDAPAEARAQHVKAGCERRGTLHANGKRGAASGEIPIIEQPVG